MRITNTQAGPRGVNTTAGVVLLGPGEARDLDLPDAELAVARRTGWFAFGEPEPEPEPAAPAAAAPQHGGDKKPRKS
ncbi:hypothetical protein RHODGE_RHODGE_01021 [Rhodoplanes serenus]|uniref:Uncharacterized protein n=1 Tax=Rhodoplanes serenus TaxID=200615 RepID=A0A3S4BSX9_9BRAD|nr:hypothetical protein [Rhodoplanes serenus]VCU06587.1 hypothetical protein RHODPL_RHODPL_00035 [Rhodoplanes serenus]VCU07871.1 hypothetical protein RHODGE_RHODGE_01021 [Rhodoplanes serenus]